MDVYKRFQLSQCYFAPKENMATTENLRSGWFYYKLGNCTICNGDYATQNFIRSALACYCS
jgi:hypothetical protein